MDFSRTIEQHKDNIEDISTAKASDMGKPDDGTEIANNEIPGIEVKNVGSPSFGWNSTHKEGLCLSLPIIA